MLVTASVQETSYGFVELEVPDGTPEEEIYQKVEDAYYNGQIQWTGGDFSVNNIDIPEQQEEKS
jgi:hypothetical protein